MLNIENLEISVKKLLKVPKENSNNELNFEIELKCKNENGKYYFHTEVITLKKESINYEIYFLNNENNNNFIKNLNKQFSWLISNGFSILLDREKNANTLYKETS